MEKSRVIHGETVSEQKGNGILLHRHHFAHVLTEAELFLAGKGEVRRKTRVAKGITIFGIIQIAWASSFF